MSEHGTSRAPVSPRTLQRFAVAFTDALDGIAQPATAALVVAAEARGDTGLVVAVVSTQHREGEVAHLDRVTAGAHRLLAAGLRLGWSPTRDGASSPSWLALAVGRGQPVWAAVRRDTDRCWTGLAPDGLPWLALSTAGALRAAMDSATPLQLKRTSDPRLVQHPEQQPWPPTDEHGRL